VEAKDETTAQLNDEFTVHVEELVLPSPSMLSPSHSRAFARRHHPPAPSGG
jgi:hypothetical protein